MLIRERRRRCRGVRRSLEVGWDKLGAISGPSSSAWLLCFTASLRLVTVRGCLVTVRLAAGSSWAACRGGRLGVEKGAGLNVFGILGMIVSVRWPTFWLLALDVSRDGTLYAPRYAAHDTILA